MVNGLVLMLIGIFFWAWLADYGVHLSLRNGDEKGCISLTTKPGSFETGLSI